MEKLLDPGHLLALGQALVNLRVLYDSLRRVDYNAASEKEAHTEDELGKHSEDVVL